MIAGYDRFRDLTSAMWTKAEKIDVTKARRVGKEPFITKYLKGITNTHSAGYVDTGESVSTPSSVTVDGATATMNTCLDLSHIKRTNRNRAAHKAHMPPPHRVTVSLVRQASSWLVTGLKSGEATCVSG